MVKYYNLQCLFFFNTTVFNVTWSFKNHSTDSVLKKHFLLLAILKIVVLLSILVETAFSSPRIIWWIEYSKVNIMLKYICFFVTLYMLYYHFWSKNMLQINLFLELSIHHWIWCTVSWFLCKILKYYNDLLLLKMIFKYLKHFN